jgi:hypothetical protein
MRRLELAAAVSLALIATGCCDESVKARAFFGHLTQDECMRKMNEPEAPVSIICPGSEVTVCWSASKVDSTTITVSPDPDGNSGTFGPTGVMHLKPGKDTEVEIKASDCASTKKKIMVLDEPKPAFFDGHWTTSCTHINYELNPAFVDDKVDAVDVTARFFPTFRNGDGSIGTCTTPPFLKGEHPIEGFFFDIPMPFTTLRFSRPLKAIDDWNYFLTAGCPQGLKCEPFVALPFNMTLQCPSGLQRPVTDDEEGMELEDTAERIE